MASKQVSNIWLQRNQLCSSFLASRRTCQPAGCWCRLQASDWPVVRDVLQNTPCGRRASPPPQEWRPNHPTIEPTVQRENPTVFGSFSIFMQLKQSKTWQSHNLSFYTWWVALLQEKSQRSTFSPLLIASCKKMTPFCSAICKRNQVI